MWIGVEVGFGIHGWPALGRYLIIQQAFYTEVNLTRDIVIRQEIFLVRLGASDIAIHCGDEDVQILAHERIFFLCQ